MGRLDSWVEVFDSSGDRLEQDAEEPTLEHKPQTHNSLERQYIWIVSKVSNKLLQVLDFN